MRVDQTHKTKVLICIDWYLPGYKAGGPIQSVANLVAQLKNEIEFSIITSDSDFGDTEPYPGVLLNNWNDRGDGARTLYLSKSNQSARGLKKFINPNHYDYIYLNGVFSYTFTILPLMLFKSSSAHIILGSRGMLGKGALKIKGFKKKVFLEIMKTLGVYNNIVWQATDSEESADIASVFGKKTVVHIASDIAAPVDSQMQVREKSENELKLVFLSRISEKKNLDGLIERLSLLNVKGDICLDIYGPIEDEIYWERCEKLIKTAPDNIQIVYRGAIPQPQIRSVLEKYHFFVMLTRHENFGHAIFEALSVGCPLIISDNTPWRNLFEAKVGWDLSLSSLEEFDIAIKTGLEMGQEEYTEMANSAHQYALNYIDNDPSVAQSRTLLGIPGSE